MGERGGVSNKITPQREACMILEPQGTEGRDANLYLLGGGLKRPEHHGKYVIGHTLLVSLGQE